MTRETETGATRKEPASMDTVCGRCGKTWGKHIGFNCPAGGEWTERLADDACPDCYIAGSIAAFRREHGLLLQRDEFLTKEVQKNGPLALDLMMARAERDALKEVADEMVAHYTRNGGCGNCGGLPHSERCWVGRFAALAIIREGQDAKGVEHDPRD